MLTQALPGRPRSFWKVVLESVQVEGQSGTFTDSRANSGQGTIVDSGTSFGYLPSSMFSKVLHQIKSYCASSSKCKGQSASCPVHRRQWWLQCDAHRGLVLYQAHTCPRSRCATL